MCIEKIVNVFFAGLGYINKFDISSAVAVITQAVLQSDNKVYIPVPVPGSIQFPAMQFQDGLPPATQAV